MNNYKDLKIWQKAIELSVNVYQVTREFPKTELFGLSSQMRRSAVSIASNIAEGAGRNSNKEFTNFLGIANGSTCELETQIILANRIDLLDQPTLKALLGYVTEIQKMNWSLKRSLLKAKPTKDQTKD